ncbi:methyl-accepting chemotaxis protein [Methylomarinovum tepidoasis]|uniref:Methyl-accepting chemotaxis protein n=1 Tax=Methylomarinovum tepidoasis TaxID=2840183 RepID=A0AAU9C628_9GAMM|nr:methyl-accepting chemotaxis protein [Methylomarinovum sp. IN45]BCX87840.1 methyl-accepting chemotaxis protein [Methylomarinovum sp. IN45]
MFLKQSIGIRLFKIVFAAFVLVACLLLVLYWQQQRRAAIAQQVDAARKVVTMAESVRHRVSRLWDLEVITPEKLREFDAIANPQERRRKILATVPVVVAWKVIQDKVAREGFELRTPRPNARNPKNEPTPLERQALEYFASHPNADEYVVFDDEANAVRYFRPVRLEQQCMICHGDPATSQALWGRSDGRDILGYPMDGKRPGDLHGSFEIVASLDEAMAAVRNNMLKAGLGMTLAIGLFGWVFYRLTQHMISRPLQAMGDQLQAIGDGDLTVQLDVNSEDEVGAMARHINAFSSRIRQLVNDLQATISHLNRAAGEMAGIAQETEAKAEKQHRNTEHTTASIQELSASIQEVAQTTSEAEARARETDAEAKQGHEVVTAATGQIRALAGEIDQVTEELHKLEADSKNIGEVLEIIRGIADQTNLLALNAAIEAARAGEQGRGFAVVAEEVRTLASRTQESTAQIQETIDELRNRARSAVEMIEHSRESAHQGAERTEAVDEALSNIIAMVEATGALNTQIATTIEQQSAVSETINRSVDEINQGSLEVCQKMEETLQATEQLRQTAARLEEAVNRFRT